MYQGEWIKGIQHGYGKMIFPNGVIKEGAFEYNVFKGPKTSDGPSPAQPTSMGQTLKNNNFYAGPNPNASISKG
jgi:hypothetical protein